jgi:hypothetical protein
MVVVAQVSRVRKDPLLRKGGTSLQMRALRLRHPMKWNISEHLLVEAGAGVGEATRMLAGTHKRDKRTIMHLREILALTVMAAVVVASKPTTTLGLEAEAVDGVVMAALQQLLVGAIAKGAMMPMQVLLVGVVAGGAMTRMHPVLNKAEGIVADWHDSMTAQGVSHMAGVVAEGGKAS